MALAVVETDEVRPHAATAALSTMLVRLAEVTADALAGVDDDASEADLVDQIGVLERLRSAVAAAQAAATMRLARARVERETLEGRKRETVGRGLAEEIGLACRISPTVAARRLGAARAWWSDLPCTFAALATGRLHERVAAAVVGETRHLPGATRRDVDGRLHGHGGDVGLADLGVRQALATVAKAAYAADPRAYVERGRHEREDRHVTLRPAPDTMSVLSGYLPVEQGVACLAALKRHTDTAVAAGDGRSRGQIMADTLVERVTGQAGAGDVAFEIQLVVPEGAQPEEQGPSTATATLTGAGSLPLGTAVELVDASRATKHVRVLRRSGGGHLVGIGSRRRFTGALADLVVARDQTCREPYCDAPVRHLDHVERHADGGGTDLANGRGLCARHNLAREQPGWRATVVHDGLGSEPHTVRTTTPTGHRYLGRAPDPP